MKEYNSIKINLGDYKLYRYKLMFVCISLLLISILVCFTYIKVFHGESGLVISIILLLAAFITSIIGDSKLLKSVHETNCFIDNNCLHIENERFSYKFHKDSIRLVYKKSLYMGKTTKVEAFALVVESMDKKKYKFYSAIGEFDEMDYNNTDLKKLHDLFNRL